MDKQRYKVVGDAQQDDFAMGVNFTIEQWQMQAISWCFHDDNKGLANYIRKLPQNTELLDIIGEIWSIEFAPIGVDDKVDDCDRDMYANITVEQFYNELFSKNGAIMKGVKNLYDTIKVYYSDLDDLAKRLQDNYNDNVPFEQYEQDRLSICGILDIFDKITVMGEIENTQTIEIKIIGIDEIDEYICECGNTIMDIGFVACDIDGNEIEPNENWQGLYKCANCGAMHYIKQ